MVKEKGREVRISPEQLISLYQNQRASMDALVQQEQALLAGEREVIGAEEALKEISSSAKPLRSLFLLGAGVFVEGELRGQKVKSDIGANVLQEVSIKKALEQLAEKKKNISSSLLKLRKRKKELALGLARMEAMLVHYQKVMGEKQSVSPGVS